MEIRNLRYEDVSVLQKKIEELKKNNPDITSNVFSMEEEHKHRKIEESLEKIEKKLNQLLIHFGLAKEDILII